jgi:hypothetical protein
MHYIRAQRFLTVVSAGCFAVVVWDLVVGGFHTSLLGFRLSSWEAYKPFLYGVISAAFALWLRDRAAPSNRISWELWRQYSRWIAAGAALVFVLVALASSADAAGGPDGYGYVSEALLWPPAGWSSLIGSRRSRRRSGWPQRPPRIRSRGFPVIWSRCIHPGCR